MSRRKQTKYFQDAVMDHITELADTLIRKQIDYGPNAISRFGMDGIVIRISDKLERLINLTQLKSEPEVDESVEDTLRDMAGYAILGLMVLEGNFPLPIKQKEQV
ncbi:hypothetical protein DCC39_10315 [Pueribacillus theae]|uniref:Nucleotide modification associated domain-containing protein n=1 Tax=Pueribacillus theae TaxID=2171751 RepID=A0A2U1K270_9BACI|nr:nucleotide modification associated domain-containing protein [Pueribacillus theae]PWA11083.1 hypothetical protein DCC39_10315 [Pueribacillus theae]